MGSIRHTRRCRLVKVRVYLPACVFASPETSEIALGSDPSPNKHQGILSRLISLPFLQIKIVKKRGKKMLQSYKKETNYTILIPTSRSVSASKHIKLSSQSHSIAYLLSARLICLPLIYKNALHVNFCNPKS
jgi:hypothetical protein